MPVYYSIVCIEKKLKANMSEGQIRNVYLKVKKKTMEIKVIINIWV